MFRTEPKVEATKRLARRISADGSPAEMPLYLARPAGGGGEQRPGLVLIQEIFGVNAHIQDVARRFAGQGYVVAAPDLLYRSGPWLTFGYDRFLEARPHVAKLTGDLVTGDIAATLEFLAAQGDVAMDRVGIVGYCFGGRVALTAAERLPDRFKAAAVYYGGGIVSDDPEAPVRRVNQITCPVVGFFGGLDKHIPEEHVRQLERALTEAGVENQVYLYPDADHGFFCDARPGFSARAAEDAWHRTLWFFGSNLGPVPAVEWQ